MPAMLPDQFFTEVTRRKRQIKARKFDGCITSNVVEKSVVNNTRPFVIPKSATEQYTHIPILLEQLMNGITWKMT